MLHKSLLIFCLIAFSFCIPGHCFQGEGITQDYVIMNRSNIRKMLENANHSFFHPQSMRLELLKSCPETIPTVAKLLYDEWHPYDASLTENKLIQSLTGRLNDDQIPITFIALKDTKPIGLISLKARSDSEFTDFPKNSIWMGSLIVIPEERNQGLGNQLLQCAATVAKDMGYKELYFYSSNPTSVVWYAKRGAIILDHRTFRGHTITIMRINLE